MPNCSRRKGISGDRESYHWCRDGACPVSAAGDAASRLSTGNRGAPPPMIVMKFGGTSVQDAKAIERVAHIVQGRLADRPVVVVSAMAKVTDSLLAMGKAAGGGDRKTALKMARALRERHYDTAGELLGTALFTEFHGDLGADFEDLDELLRGIGAGSDFTDRANPAQQFVQIFEVGAEVAVKLSEESGAEQFSGGFIVAFAQGARHFERVLAIAV